MNKKNAVIVVLSLMVVSLSSVSFSGLSVASLIAQTFPIDMSAIMKQIQQLQTQMNSMKGTTAIPVPSVGVTDSLPSPEKSVTSPASDFSRDLTLGSQGADVAALQKILIDGGYLKIAVPTESFGPMTKTALAAWQKANSLSGTGYFGALSRAKMSGSSVISAADAGEAISNFNFGQTPASFIKTYHLWNMTEGLGVFPLKNGGYLLTGDVISGAGVFYPYIVRTDDKGNALWSKRLGSSSNVASISSTRHIGRKAVEMADGGIVMVSDTSDFIDAEYEKVREIYGDILVTKLSASGAKIWSIMFGDYSTDQPQKLWALPDGGVMVLSRFMQTGFGNNVADTGALPKHSVLTKIDKEGQIQISKKLAWDAVDMELLPDGSFISLANITIPKSEQPQVMGSGATMGDLPTIIKINSALNLEWAKTIESVSSDMVVPTGLVNGKVTTNVIKLRASGGDFKTIQLTSDGGFVAFGYDSLYTKSGMYGLQTVNMAEYTNLRPFIAVKFDAMGKYIWARKLTGSLSPHTTAIDFHTARTTDNGFVISQEVYRDGNWVSYEGNLEALKKAGVSNLELIKTDANFNPKWVRKFDVERETSGYDMAPTADGGAVLTGIVSTNKTYVAIDGVTSYKEAVLAKADLNGNVSGCTSVTDHPKVTVEDESQYIVSQNMTVGASSDIRLNINKKVNEKVSVIEDVARGVCEWEKSNAVPVNTYLNTNILVAPAAGQSVAPVANTWVQVNYDNAKEGTIVAEKNRRIHDELLPILKNIFGNQVKMTDSMDGGWLEYIFSRLVTRADVEAVQKAYSGLGYKIDESEGETLNVSKIGTSLRMTFSITNPMKGKLEVMF